MKEPQRATNSNDSKFFISSSKRIIDTGQHPGKDISQYIMERQCRSKKIRIFRMASIVIATFIMLARDLILIKMKDSSVNQRVTRNDLDSIKQEYEPSIIEKYIIDNLGQFGFNSANDPRSCAIWNDQNASNAMIHGGLLWYSENLDEYIKAYQNFQPVNIDVLEHIQKNQSYSVCDTLKLHPSGLDGIFQSNQLSMTKSGWVEPLTPPLRFHKFCSRKRYLMSIDHLVHDFETMCRNLKITSKRVFIDMGADLNFAGGVGGSKPAIMKLWDLYEKFGFRFDHIYAFEITPKDAKQVYEKLLPEKYFASYHWINAGVSHVEGHKMNPLNSILRKFSEDDLIVVKLDIDTPSVELPIMEQLLEGGPDGIYHRLIDQFYFEHHVHMKEMVNIWPRGQMQGTLKDSLEMFYGLRQKGIPAHYWP